MYTINSSKTALQRLLLVAIVCLINSSLMLAFSHDNGGDNPQSTSEDKISKYQKSKYKKDATRLALRQLAKGQAFENLDAEVPKDLVESIYNSLIAVHQSNLEAAKTVTRVHKLHTFPTPTVDHLVVIYKRDAPWATPLRLGDDVTDNDKINQLSEKFNLKINRHGEWDEEHNSFNMHAEEALNIASLAKDISTVESVSLVDMMEPNGDGNDIEITPIKNGWKVSYVIKFDGCISGCKKNHTWTFEVTNSGKVKFVSESGDELPKWMK